MRFWLTAAALAAALVLAGGPTARAATTCQMQELAELPVRIDGPSNTIEVQINGQPARMIVDTGAAVPQLLRSGAARLGLPLGSVVAAQITSYGVGGKDQGAAARIKEFRVGNFVDRNIDMLVSGQGLTAGVDGLLGASFLLQTDVEFDLPEGKIRFFKPKDCAGDQVVYWGKAYSDAPLVGDPRIELVVMVSLDGAPVRAQMDTGASTSVVTMVAAARAGVTPASAGVTDSGGIRGTGPQAVQSWVGVFPSFSFGDETIRNAKLQIADLFHANKQIPIGTNIPTSALEEPQMLLGSDFFRAHRVYVSKAQRKVYVSYMGGPVFKTWGTRSTAPPTALSPAAPPTVAPGK